jgi:hypothetical protein
LKSNENGVPPATPDSLHHSCNNNNNNNRNHINNTQLIANTQATSNHTHIDLWEALLHNDR